MSVPIDPIEPGDGGGGGGGGGGTIGDVPPYGALPGLALYLRKRYTCNLAVTEEIPLVDLLHEVIFITSRMYLTQGANGKIRMHNKKPVDWALGLSAFSSASKILSVDDVSAWILNTRNFLLIDPHTDDSEIRQIVAAKYPTSQNSVTFTTDGGANITIVGFAGSDGAATPATASITINSFAAGTPYTITLDAVPIVFTPSASDTTVSVASFIAGAIRGHPALGRRFAVAWVEGASVVTITARYGTLEIDNALTKTHVAPVSNPTVAPTLTATAAGTFAAGAYSVAYAYKNEHGQTLLSPYETVTLAVNEKITVTAIVPPAGSTVVWYTVPAAGSAKLRYHSENSGASFVISTLPLLSAPLPPDVNRTGTEVMRVMAAFSDRLETRSNTLQSNVIRGTFQWLLGNRKNRKNRVDFTYRDASQDYREVTDLLRDDANIAKIKKVENLEINGNGVDNYFQAYRIAAGILNEEIHGDFLYRWTATRKALLLEEGDVVAITDSGSGVVNFPVWIQEISLDLSKSSMPMVAVTGSKYANTLWDDSVVERTIPIVTENGAWIVPPPPPDADAQAFFTASGITDTTQKNAVNQLVVDLKAASLWTKMFAIYPFVGGTAATHKWNLKNPADTDAAYRLIFNGGWVHSATGALPNGTTGYADTKLAPSALTEHDLGWSIYSRTDALATVADAGAVTAGVGTGPVSLLRSTVLGASNLLVDYYNGIGDRLDGTVADSLGLFTFTATSATIFKAFKNGVQIGTTKDPAGSAVGVTQTFYLGAYNSGGTAALFSTREQALTAFHSGLTDAECAAFNTAVATYQTALSRNV